MAETLFEEIKRYVGFSAEDQRALHWVAPVAAPEFSRIADTFYQRILEHEGSRKALEGGESQVGRLKITLVAWMDKLLNGPWNEEYFELRCRIGRVHVRIALPQHYMFGAMNVVRIELNQVIREHFLTQPEKLQATQIALSKILDLELAIMLHTYREDLLAQQAKSERLSTFGQLVGSIGHELRNPLGVIETSLFILRSRTSTDERAQKHVARMGEQLFVANRIITNLLDMIRDRPLVRERVLLGEIVDSAVAAVPHPDAVAFVLKGISTLPFVMGDKGQLRQVFLNLLENAAQATSPQGEVHVSGSVAERQVVLVVEDSGPGIDDTIRRRLFEPLMTTKEKGIGLGLSLVRRIVERHQGSIAYEPGGRGARFVLRLPIAE